MKIQQHPKNPANQPFNLAWLAGDGKIKYKATTKRNRKAGKRLNARINDHEKTAAAADARPFGIGSRGMTKPGSLQ